jgi:competence ComEA-like helix-hairpin-helix protein
MRLPFFKSTKVEQNEPVKALTTSPRLAGVNPRPQLPKLPAAPPVPTPASNADAPTVKLFLRSLLPQLPSQLFVDNPPTPLESVAVSIPASLVLPRLNTGRIDVRLTELLPHLPFKLIRRPLPNFPENHTVVLPLAEVIEALPPELLTLHHESEITADDPELDKLPKLIDDALLVEPTVPATPAPEPEPQPQPVAPAPAGAAVSPRVGPVTDVPEHVLVKLGSLMNVMPDSVFSCPRAELPKKADFNSMVLLKVEPMLPQLRFGSVKLPVSLLLPMVPHPLLANPMPKLEGVTIPVPLAEIIPQLPQHLFTDHLRDPQPHEFEAVETNFPDPFQERSALPAEAQPVSPPVPEQLEVEPAFSAESLADESLEIFAEKSPAPPAPVAPVEPEVAIAPVQAPEPVAEVAAPIEAVVEPVAEVPPATVEPEIAPVPVAEVPAEAATEPVAAEAEPFDEQKFMINLNRCTVEDLMMIPGVGRALAMRIVEFRNTAGKFNSIEDLRQIPGIGRKTFRALAGAQPRALNRLLGAEHDNELTLQEIVRLAGQMPGVEGCMLALSDGLFLTGELPSHLDQNTVSVFAPQLFKKVGRYARELKVGQIRRFTIFTDTQPISIFRAGDVYLIVVHDTVHFSKALLRRCERISQEIARLCRQRAVV